MVVGEGDFSGGRDKTGKESQMVQTSSYKMS